MFKQIFFVAIAYFVHLSSRDPREPHGQRGSPDDGRAQRAAREPHRPRLRRADSGAGGRDPAALAGA